MAAVTTVGVALAVAGLCLYFFNKVCSEFDIGSYVAGHIAYFIEFFATLAIISGTK